MHVAFGSLKMHNFWEFLFSFWVNFHFYFICYSLKSALRIEEFWVPQMGTPPGPSSVPLSGTLILFKGVIVFAPLFLMRKLRHQEVKSLSRGELVSAGLDSHPGQPGSHPGQPGFAPWTAWIHTLDSLDSHTSLSWLQCVFCSYSRLPLMSVLHVSPLWAFSLISILSYVPCELSLTALTVDFP